MTLDPLLTIKQITAETSTSATTAVRMKVLE